MTPTTSRPVRGTVVVTYQLERPDAAAPDEPATALAIALFQNGVNASEAIGNRILAAVARRKGLSGNPQPSEPSAMAGNRDYELLPGLFFRVSHGAWEAASPILRFWADPDADVPLVWQERLFKVPFILFDCGGMTDNMALEIAQRIVDRYPMPDSDDDP